MEDWLFQLRKLRDVRRCGVLRVLSEMSVAEHSYYVAVIAVDMARRIEETQDKIVFDKAILLQKALFHDAEEGIIGDIPYPIKHASPEINQMFKSSQEAIVSAFFPNWMTFYNLRAKEGLEGEIIQIADYVELYFYCAEEILLGNKRRDWQDIMDKCREICGRSRFNLVAEEYFMMVDQYMSEGAPDDVNKVIGRAFT